MKLSYKYECFAVETEEPEASSKATNMQQLPEILIMQTTWIDLKAWANRPAVYTYTPTYSTRFTARYNSIPNIAQIDISTLLTEYT